MMWLAMKGELSNIVYFLLQGNHYGITKGIHKEGDINLNQNEPPTLTSAWPSQAQVPYPPWGQADD
jgi:hypothetical protein